MLATSHAALRVSVEHEFPVPPLELPDPRRSASAAACGSRSNPDAVRRHPKGDLEARPARADAPR
jgi:hypothetical protein